MTRRERLEAKIERRREWAAKAHVKSEQRFAAVSRIADNIPFGQPILVGHHSEKHARRDAERIHNGIAKAVELADMANHHESKAGGLEAQLATTIFSDDENAVDAPEAKVAKLEKRRDDMKAINKAWKKKDAKALEPFGLSLEKLAEQIATLPSYQQAQPFPGYSLTNIGGRIRQAKKRIEEVKRRHSRQSQAEAAGGVVVTDCGDYVQVTFAEKPEREVLDALRSAGFWWAGGSWTGRKEALPSGIVTE
jgi:DNA repair exonuclease SbcCD ATPase subunit